MSARLFAEIDPGDDAHALLDAAGVRHLRALRLVRGDVVHAIVAPGDVREATIESVEPARARLRLGDRLPRPDADPTEPVLLAIALGDLARMEVVIEKATELGATAIVPFVAARSQVRDVAPARLARWQRIARAACEQCGRTSPPSIAAAVALADVLAQLPEPSRIALLVPPGGDRGTSFASLARDTSAVAWIVVVGPEGGLTPEEEQMMRQRGAAPVSLGPRVLRFETAAMAALAALDAARNAHR